MWQQAQDCHLIEPLGFQINEKQLKRAGLDYWDKLDVTTYVNFEDFLAKNPGAKIYMATTKARKKYTDVKFEDDAYIMFGKESAVYQRRSWLIIRIHLSGFRCSQTFVH